MPQITGPAKLAKDEEFRDRALVAALVEAISVVREADEVPNHAFRVAYAQSLLRGPEQYRVTVSWVLASALGLDPSYADVPQEQIPDALLSGALHGMWNYLSTP